MGGTTNFKTITPKSCKYGKPRMTGKHRCADCLSKLQRLKQKEQRAKQKVREVVRRAKKKEKKASSYTTFQTKADTRWREEIHKIWKDKCAICPKTNNLNCHHYIGRRNKSTRWYRLNGILLCSGHHKLLPQSAHESPEWFRNKMIELLGESFLKDITLQANKDWDKNKESVFKHLNWERNSY
jgi:hypothetical protein